MDMARWAATAAGLPGGAALVALGLGCFLLRDGHCAWCISKPRLSRLEPPCVKSLGSVKRSFDVAPGSDGSSGSAAPQKVQPSALQGFWKKQDEVSYSTLLRDIDAKEIKQLDLVPVAGGRGSVQRGRRVTVSVLPTTIKFCGQPSSGTPLTVIDIRREQAGRELAGTLVLVLLVVVGLSFLLKRSAQMANRALGFGRSQPS